MENTDSDILRTLRIENASKENSTLLEEKLYKNQCKIFVASYNVKEVYKHFEYAIYFFKTKIVNTLIN